MQGIKWLLAAALALALVIAASNRANADGTGTFEVGSYWQPPKYIGADYNTNANWANMAAAKIDMATAIRVPAGTNLDKAANETGIANSSANNVKLLVTDSSIYGHPVNSAAEIAALQAAVTPYAGDSRVKGINLKDEPMTHELLGYANAYKAIKALDPDLDVYVNLLPGIAGMNPYPGKLFYANSTAQGFGNYITPSAPIGQTITIPANVSYLDGVVFYIDSLQWASNETLTLKLWNSPAKTSLIGQGSIAGNGSGNAWEYYKYFMLGKTVTPGGTYYLELVHNGGGDNSVGWAIRSNTDTYAGGQAYENGAAKAYDFNFQLFTERTNGGTPFENYLDDWLQYSGADTLLYDNYPFRTTGDDAGYFDRMESVRGRGLANDVIYGAFLQSVEIPGAYRNTSLNEKRMNVYSYLTYGFKKLNWFTYWTPDAAGGETFQNAPVSASGGLQAGYAQIQTLNTEMRNLGGTLKDLVSVRVYHSGSSIPSKTIAVPDDFFVKPSDLSQPIIEGYFTNAAGRKYVMLTNRDYASARTLTFQFSPKPASLTEISKSTGLEVGVPGYNAATGALSITLNQGEGRLFALPAGFSPYANLAAEAAVSATSSYESTADDGWGVSKVHDDNRGSGTVNGVISSGWSSKNNLGANHTESITFDLGAAKTVGEVVLFPRGGGGAFYPVDFTIQVAANAGGPWTTVAAKTGQPQASTAQWIPFAPVTARYVKVEGTNLRLGSGQYRMQFAEVEIYAAPNLAKGATLSASSSVEDSSWGLAKANDHIRSGVPGSNGWSSSANLSANHTESVTLNLQATRSVTKVDLYPRNDNGNVGAGFPVDFTIQVAANAGGPWTTVVTQAGYAQPGGTVQSFSFAAQTARYVRIEGTSLRQIAAEAGTPYRMQFSEIEAYGGLGASIPLANAGFESPGISGFQYGPFTNGWTFAGTSGIQHNGSAFGAASAPEGAQTALIQNAGEFSQTVNFAAGTYAVTFKAAKRPTGGTQIFNVYYDAALIGTFSPTSTGFAAFTTNSFVATAGSHTIKFVGTVLGDTTDFVDDVQIN
ncbi:hypothetical protein JOC55_001721 [Paenibacillus sacheonensis]|nr:hypothetical protein [Paenibacillus sacheonensis]